MGISTAPGGIGGWTVGPVIGRRPAGVARDVVHPGTGARAVMVIVDGRFTGRGLPDAESVARAAIVGSPAVMPMLDAGLLEDGTRWYVTPAAPGPVLDPSAGCSPRRAATIVEAVARALAAVHAAGLVHGLVGPESVVPAAGRHAERPVGTTLLLDTGVAVLLGERADDLASVSSVTMPADRGPAADVHALGGLLLRLLTAAAPAGPALAALPVELRGLLSAMLDEHPSRRPTADAVARSLAGMREGLLATAPVEVQAPAVAPVPAPTPVRAPAPVAMAPRPVARPAIVLTPRQDVPLPLVPAPIPAPHTLESPIVVPRSSPAPAPSLWTGPVPIASAARPVRRGKAKRILLLAGGVGLAGLLVGVVTHLPIGGHQDGEQAVAAAAENGVFAVPATSAPAGSSAASTTSAGTKSSKAPAVPALSLVSDVAPAFVRPTTVVPSPLAASATSTTPSRNTTPPTRRSGTTTTAPTSSSSSSSSAPTTSQSSSSTPSSSDTSSSSPSSSDTSSSAPSSDTPTTDPSSSDTSTPSDSTPTTDTPSSDPSPSDSSSDASTADASSTDTPSAG